MYNHNLFRIYQPYRVSQYLNSNQYSVYQPYKVFQLINDNNNYVNMHDVTNLGLYNKLILATQKQVLELYITAIECKTLYSFHIPHTAFPNATKATTIETMNATTNKVHVTKNRGIRTSYNLVENLGNRFLSNH